MAKTYEELLDLILEATGITGVETDEDVMQEDEVTQESVDEAYTDYLQSEVDELMTEGMLSNPLKKHLDKLKKIKQEKPAEYDGPEEVKKFVDKHYDEIVEASELLEQEPKDLRDNQIRSLVALALTWVTWIAATATVLSAPALSVFFMVVTVVLLLVNGIVLSIITYCRTSNDRKAMDDLCKVRDALAKVKSANDVKLPKAVKNKVSDLIAKIDDAETEINARIRAVKESVDEQLAIYEAAYAGNITTEDRDELLAALDSMTDGGGYLTEGTNLDQRKAGKKVASEAKDAMREAKKLMNAGKASEANEKVDVAISILKEFKEEIQDYDDSAGDIVAGSFWRYFITTLKTFCVSLLTFGIGGIVVVIKECIDILDGLLAMYKANDKLSLKMLNANKMKVLGITSRLIKQCERLKTEITKKCKEEATTSQDAATKESAEYMDDLNAARITVFEACGAGLISVSDRDALVSSLENGGMPD